MTTPDTNSDPDKNPVVGASVPTDVAAAIKKDAEATDRTPAYVIRRILVSHYAKRRKGRRGAAAGG